MLECVPKVVARPQRLPEGLGILNLAILEYLGVREHPEADGAVEDRGEHHHPDRHRIQSLVDHGRLPIVTGEQELLHDEEDDEGEESDGEQDWHTCAEHKGDVGHGQDERVFLVDQVFRPTVQIQVVLYDSAPRGVRPAYPAAFIDGLFEEAD